jgi:hypothetical protein
LSAARASSRLALLLRQGNRRRRNVQSESADQQFPSLHAHLVTPLSVDRYEVLSLRGHGLLDLDLGAYTKSRFENTGVAPMAASSSRRFLA